MRIKVMLVVSAAAAVIFWGLAATALLAGWQREGTPAVFGLAAVASQLTWLVLWLQGRREKRTDERLRELEAGFRRREAALVKTFRLLAGGPTTGPQPRLHVAGGRR